MKRIIICCLVLLINIKFLSASETSKIFSEDYFSHNINQWKRTTQHLQGKENIRCLEVGSFEGRSTIFMAETICNGKNSVVYAVDTWEGSDEHEDSLKKNLYNNFKNNLKNHLGSKRVLEFRGMSDKILLDLLVKVRAGKEKKFDFVYIDASHWAKDVMVDTVLAWEMLKVNGVMIFDDLYWNVGVNDHVGPNPAINGFLKSYDSMYEVVYSGYQLHVKKLSNRPQDKKTLNHFNQFYWKPLIDNTKVTLVQIIPEFILDIYRKHFK